MTKQFKPRRNIERATAFKVLYADAETDTRQLLEREFTNLKSLRQWVERQTYFCFCLLKTLALIDGEWEPFTTIGKTTITVSDLESKIRNMRDPLEGFKPSEIEK